MWSEVKNYSLEKILDLLLISPVVSQITNAFGSSMQPLKN